MALESLLEFQGDQHHAPGISPDLKPGTVLVSRFEVKERLGAGAMGHVFAAYDRDRKVDIALKVLGRLTPHTIGELKTEFRTASELVHPNLVRLHELFCEGTVWFFTMDLVDGEMLPEVLRRTGKDSQTVRHIFTQLALALSALHRSGVIHRDLKPSNFLIAGPSQKVVLLDFGLAQPIGQPGALEIAGTPAYMAPEQYWGETLTEAADWYGFGVVLYEALVGALPNRVPSREQLIGAPKDLARLCVDLMNLDVGRRPTGDEVLARLNAKTDLPSDAIGSGFSAPTSLIGRSKELDRLLSALESMLIGQTSVVFVSGPSGIGKTTLVEHFVQRAQAQGVSVLRSRCRERESMSYKAVDGIIDDVAQLLDDLPKEEAAQLVPEQMAQLMILFPILRTARVFRYDTPPSFDQVERSVLRAQAIEAFAELLCRLRRRGPLVLWLDDLQWSDAESALLLEPILMGSSRIPIMLIASYRGEPKGDGGPLLTALQSRHRGNLPSVTELNLRALSHAEAERLARSVLPDDRAGLARQIAVEAAGHPLFVQELAYVRTSVELNEQETERHSFTGLVDRRLLSLPDSTREVLELTALAGGPISRTTLRRVQQLAPNAMEDSLDVLRAARLARSEGLREENSVEIYHDRVREIVLRGLPDEKKRKRHLALAQALQDDPKTKPEQLAHHFEGAGELEKAAEHYREGGDAAMEGLAFAHAAEMYRRSIELSCEALSELVETRLKRAQALAYAGKGPAAAEAYLELADERAGDDRMELQWRAAEQLLYSGHVEKGFALISELSRSLGARPPRPRGAPLVAMALGRVRVRLRGLRYRHKQAATLSRRQLMQLDVSWTVSCALSLLDPISGGRSHSDHMLQALDCAHGIHLLRALVLEATYAAAPGSHSSKRVTQLTNLAREVSEELATDGARGLFELTQALICYLRNDNRNALEHADKAIAHLSHSKGTYWEDITAHRFAIGSRFFLGRFRELSNFVPPLIEAYEGSGNRYATMCFRSAFSTVAWLVRDDADEAARQLRQAEHECEDRQYDLSHYNLLLGQTFFDLYDGEALRARRRLMQQWVQLEESHLLKIGVVRIQALQLRAGVACVTADIMATRGDRLSSERLLKEAEVCAKRLQREPVARCQPTADLILASVALSRHDKETSLRLLTKAAQTFDEQGLGMFGAATRVRLGEVIAGEAGEKVLLDALDSFAREGVQQPRRMVDVLAPGFQSRG